LAWQISNTLDVNFCLDALDLALNQGTPQIFNTGSLGITPNSV
jgi:putative transposase